MRGPEDRLPTRDQCEPAQESHAFVYPLTIRLAPPYNTRTLLVLYYEDGRVENWVCRIAGPSLV